MAVVFNRREALLYIDGRLDDKAIVFAGGLKATDAPVWIGNTYNASYERFFYGSVDDVRIYNAALIRSQIETVYSGKELRLPPRPQWLEQTAKVPIQTEEMVGQRTQALIGCDPLSGGVVFQPSSQLSPRSGKKTLSSGR